MEEDCSYAVLTDTSVYHIFPSIGVTTLFWINLYFLGLMFIRINGSSEIPVCPLHKWQCCKKAVIVALPREEALQEEGHISCPLKSIGEALPAEIMMKDLRNRERRGRDDRKRHSRGDKNNGVELGRKDKQEEQWKLRRAVLHAKWRGTEQGAEVM